MQIHRCPECGVRLTSNYCDICMRKVPFKAADSKQTFQNAEGSSAHKQEKHPCLTFDEPKRSVKTMPRISSVGQRKAQTKRNGKKVKVVAIVVAVLSVISSLFGMVEELAEPAAEPEYNYEAYVVEDSPQIASAELYNDGEILVTVDSLGLYYENYAVSFTVQNDSQKDITVTTDSLSVNNYMLTSSLYAPAEAGQTCQNFLIFDPYELETAGITEIADIVFCLRIYEAEDYTDIAITDLFTLQTDIAEGFTQLVDDSGWTLYEDGGVRMVLRGMEMSSYGDCDLEVYLENGSDQTVSVSTNSILVNGQEASGFAWNTLRPGTRAIDCVYIYDLEELDISEGTQIQEITLDLHIEYMEDWYVEETVNETITFQP